jgi:hypothetical protein
MTPEGESDWADAYGLEGRDYEVRLGLEESTKTMRVVGRMAWP